MGRHSKIWVRKGRGYFTTINGRQTFLAHDKREAQRQFQALLASTSPRAPGAHSTPQLCALWLISVKPDVKAVTYYSYRRWIELWAGAMRTIRPADIRGYHLTQWLAGHPGWNDSTRNLGGRIVKMWSAWVDSQGFIDGDRLRKVSLPQPRKREAAAPADLLRLEAAIGCDRFRDFFAVLYDTGARPGEVATLTAARVNWSDSSAIVEGKTGDRLIGLSERALEILRRLSKLHPTGPLLRPASGGTWGKSNQRYHFEKWSAVAGVSYVIPYAARHGLWQRWHDAGIDDVTVSRQLGHTHKGQPHLKLLTSNYSHANAATLASAARAASSNGAKRRKV